MFSHRLTAALAILAAVAAAQGAVALWSVQVAERHVLRGRVAADIQHGFADLATDKQRLRNWAAQRQFEADTDDRIRDDLLLHMRQTLARLNALAAQAVTLDESPGARLRQAQRGEALRVLASSIETLARGLSSKQPLPPGNDVARSWSDAAALFDRAEGRDLPRLLEDGVVREATALREKRADTDRSLRWMRGMWIGSTATLSLAVLLLAAHFARALRRPLLALSVGARALRDGRLEHRIALAGTDEFSDVARSFNTMASELAEHRRREAQARLALEEQVHTRTGELRTALQALQESDARRRRLFADISHELRTPTTAIRGEAQVTLRGRDKDVPEYKASLQRIAEAAGQLGLVIDDLLTMARTDIDALSLLRGPVELTEVLDDAVSHAEAIARASQVALRHAPWPQALPMSADAARLRQLLLALLDNAVRYSHPDGEVRLSVRSIEREDGVWAEVQIQDHGIGIDAQDLPHVFERNHRGDRARRHRADGSGLGLPIARALARGHGGDVRLSSEPGRGTTVTLTLPLAGAPVPVRA